MNFFQKLTGSLKMPQDDEIFSGESSAPKDKQAAPKTPPASLTTPEPNTPPANDEFSQAKTASFKQMLAASNQDDTGSDASEADDKADDNDELAGDISDVSLEDIPSEDNDSEGAFGTTRLANAKTATQRSRLSPIKRGLSSLRFRKEEREKEKEKEEEEIVAPEGQLAIDVYETPTEVVIKSTIAGVKPEELDIGIEENTINIRGSRHNEEKVKGEDYFYQECYWGTFSRSVILPVEVDADKAQASLTDGILTVRLPKIIKAKEKKIKIVS